MKAQFQAQFCLFLSEKKNIYIWKTLQWSLFRQEPERYHELSVSKASQLHFDNVTKHAA